MGFEEKRIRTSNPPPSLLPALPALPFPATVTVTLIVTAIVTVNEL